MYLWGSRKIIHLTHNTARETDIHILSAYGTDGLSALNIIRNICQHEDMMPPKDLPTLFYG